MKGNANQARGPVPSRNREGSTAEYAAASVWPNNIPRAHFRCEANTDKSWDIQQYPILSDDHLLTTAQSGDQQAFVELCRRYSPMVKKRIFSIVNNHEDAEDVLQDTLLRAFCTWAPFVAHPRFLPGSRVSGLTRP
jgi:hypothetical protein